MAAEHATTVATSTEVHAKEIARRREEMERAIEAAEVQARRVEAKHKAELLALQDSVSEMKMRLSQRDATLAVTKRERSGLQEDIVQLKAQLTQHTHQEAEARREAQDAVAEADELRATCALKDATLKRHQDELSAASKQLAARQASIDIAKCEVQQLRDQQATAIAAAKADVSNVASDLEAAKGAVAAKLAGVEKQLSDVTADRDATAKRLEDSEKWLDRASAERARLLALVDRLDAEASGERQQPPPPPPQMQQQQQYQAVAEQPSLVSFTSAVGYGAGSHHNGEASSRLGSAGTHKASPEDDVPQPFQLWDLPQGHGVAGESESGGGGGPRDTGGLSTANTSLLSDSSALGSDASFDEFIDGVAGGVDVANSSCLSNMSSDAGASPVRQAVHMPVHIPVDTGSLNLDMRGPSADSSAAVPAVSRRPRQPRQHAARPPPVPPAHTAKTPRPPAHVPGSPKPQRASKAMPSPALERKNRKAAIAAYLASRNK